MVYTRVCCCYTLCVPTTNTHTTTTTTPGGPACSAALGLFYEHGPYRFINNTLCYGYQHAWVDAGLSAMVYLDSPLGTGFSYSPVCTG